MKNTSVYTAEGRLNTKTQRQRDIIRSSDDSDTPPAYKTNSIKEELSLEYISSFTTQFCSVYPKRRMPFVVAENEFNIKKFVGATLRPTLLPIPELYDLYECASFLAGFILYEPLDPPNEVPKSLFSPQRVLEQNAGDCFDLSTLLASVLLGAGYDAMVVMGYAPKYIALRDQSHTKCPLLVEKWDPDLDPPLAFDDDDDSEENSSPSQESKETVPTEDTKEGEGYVPLDNTLKSSKFLAQVAEEQKQAACDPFRLWEGPGLVQPSSTSTGGPETEMGTGSGDMTPTLHAWVMIRPGRRDINTLLFIEPSTGRAYPINNDGSSSHPYLGVEAVWGPTNFYVLGGVNGLVPHHPRTAPGTKTSRLSATNTTSNTTSEVFWIPINHIDFGRALSTAANPNSQISQNLGYQTQNTQNLGLTTQIAQTVWEAVFLEDGNPNDNRDSGEEHNEKHDEDFLSGGGNNNTTGGNNAQGGTATLTPQQLQQQQAAQAAQAAIASNLRRFDAPPRWSMPLNLPRTRYLAQYPPAGRRTVIFHCAKADFFAKGANSQQMVLRVTQYLDKECTIVASIIEWFSGRMDKLFKRRRLFLSPSMSTAQSGGQGRSQQMVVQLYHPGARDEVRRWIEIPGRRIAIDFYLHGRLDRLQRRVENVGRRIREYFHGRADRLEYRETLLTPLQAAVGSVGVGNSTGNNVNTNNNMLARQFLLPRTLSLGLELAVTKMTQQYAPFTAQNKGTVEESIEGTGTIKRRTFFVREGKAVFEQHFLPQQVTGVVRTVLHAISSSAAAAIGTASAPGTAGGANLPQGGGNTLFPNTTNLAAVAVGGILGSSIPLSEQALAQEDGRDETPEALQEAALLERECFASIKQAYQQHERLVEAVLSAELKVEPERTVFERALHGLDQKLALYKSQPGLAGMADGNLDGDTMGAGGNNKGVDYLAPFLKTRASDPTNLTREEALAIRQACLDALKQRIVERASIIQSKLHEENSKLAKRQELFQRSQREGDYSTEDYEKYCTEAMFRIGILEQRLLDHENNAPNKYAALDAKLANDPRLRVLRM